MGSPMAITEGTLSLSGTLYDMSAASSYTGGSTIGKIVDVLGVQFGRDVITHSRYDQGDTPFYARINGESCRLKVRISDYGAAWIKLVSQQRRPSGATQNYHFGLGASYKLGQPLDTTYLKPLMVKDSSAPSTNPSLFIAAALVDGVSEMRMNFGDRLLDVAEISILAIHDETVGGLGYWGDYTQFPTYPVWS